MVLWEFFEMEKVFKGSRAIANSLSEATHKGAISIVGGGDSAAAVHTNALKRKNYSYFYRWRCFSRIP